MRVLVVDDKELHRKSALATLAEHDVTISGSFDEAMYLIERDFDLENVQRLLVEAGFPAPPKRDTEWKVYDKARREAEAKSRILFPFEAVLTDMMMPMSREMLAGEVYKFGELVPYGFIIALKACLRGAKFVAMITDTNHHMGAMSAAIDHIGRAYYDTGLYGRLESFSPNFVINGAKAMFMHAPFTSVPGTICPECDGAESVMRMCSRCKGDGVDHSGKDWGRVLADLIR